MHERTLPHYGSYTYRVLFIIVSEVDTSIEDIHSLWARARLSSQGAVALLVSRGIQLLCVYFIRLWATAMHNLRHVRHTYIEP